MFNPLHSDLAPHSSLPVFPQHPTVLLFTDWLLHGHLWNLIGRFWRDILLIIRRHVLCLSTFWADITQNSELKNIHCSSNKADKVKQRWRKITDLLIFAAWLPAVLCTLLFSITLSWAYRLMGSNSTILRPEEERCLYAGQNYNDR